MADTIHRPNPLLRWVLRIIVIGYLVLLVAWPVSIVVQRAFLPTDGSEAGVLPLLARLSDPAVVYAFQLTIVVAFWAVIINTVFGVGASLLLVRHDFPGRRALSVLMDLPMSVSPVVVGLALVLAYSHTSGWFGGFLRAIDVTIIFSTPGIILATIFVSMPLVMREVIPVLQEVGNDQEVAARSLGASAWQSFRRITVPAIRWALLHGVVLSMARALGEFGAVKIVSQGAAFNGETATLLVQNRYGNFEESTAYAAALVLVLMATVAIVIVALARPTERPA